jgi:hypothetical protein
MTAFCKSANCPSSDNILSFLNGRLPDDAAEEIGAHLGVCDFCSAEADFYKHFPHVPNEPIRPVEIPSHLYQLAEALLNDRRRGLSSLGNLLSDESGSDRRLS